MELDIFDKQRNPFILFSGVVKVKIVLYKELKFDLIMGVVIILILITL